MMLSTVLLSRMHTISGGKLFWGDQIIFGFREFDGLFRHKLLFERVFVMGDRGC